jgi:PAS domain S-box-containing protein
MSSAQVLVVEDENIVARAIQNELQSMGYFVSGIASSGEEAVEKAALTHPDIVLMDIVLKGNMDGVQAAKQVRERLDIPVVFLSAYEDDETLTRARTSEPFGYLLKPYEERELHTTIETALYKHRMERRLKESHQWLHATLRSIGDAVIATDGRQYIQLLNPAAEKLTGWNADSAAHCDLSEVCRLRSDEQSAPLEAAIHKALREGSKVDMPPDTVLAARDGRETAVDGSVAPIYDDEGSFTGLVVALRDVSERRMLEKLHRQSEEYLRHAQKMEAVSRLAGGVAHDFNNLLTAILGNTSLVLSGLSKDDPNLDMLVQVEAAALRAAELVKHLLGFSGRTSLWLEPVNLNQAVAGWRQTLSEIVRSDIHLDWKVAPDLWMVQADPAQISEVLINLCLNARDAMPDGGTLTVETTNVVIPEDYLRRCLQAQPGEFVRLRVQDTGHGIPAAIQGRIFEPFFSTREPGQGTGLGLALVFGIVQQLHGWIDFRSEAGEGTTFDVYLPRYWQEAADVPVMAVSPRPRGLAETILLADDEPMIRNLGRTILQRCGYHVVLAEDGVQAVDLYRRERDRIDLVILDLTMPKLSGEDALRQMLEVNPAVRVLFSSGYFADHVTARGEHILGFLGKPYRQDDLLRTVREALDQVKDERARRQAGTKTEPAESLLPAEEGSR